jgi:hypothetical protein
VARSLLGSFVSGARQVLTAQLFISVMAVALAGWTLAVTNEVLRERDRLRERVIQLEQTMAARGEMPPPAPAVVERPAPLAQDYPGSIEPAGSRPASVDATGTGARDVGRFIGDLFAPPPPMRLVVLHAYSSADQASAQRIAAELARVAEVRVEVAATARRRGRQAGYAYYDGRQSRAAAALVQQVNDIARGQSIAPWSAQLRGTALPAQGEYAADRLDIVLPPLPAPPRIDADAEQPPIDAQLPPAPTP